jgi:hypothetical protein
MNWNKLLKTPSKLFNRIKGSKTLNEDQNTFGTVEYHVTINLKEGVSLPTKKIKEVILQNPWSTTNQPSINFSSDENGLSKADISFMVINKEKGKIIENELLAFYNKI